MLTYLLLYLLLSQQNNLKMKETLVTESFYILADSTSHSWLSWVPISDTVENDKGLKIIHSFLMDKNIWDHAGVWHALVVPTFFELFGKHGEFFCNSFLYLQYVRAKFFQRICS